MRFKITVAPDGAGAWEWKAANQDGKSQSGYTPTRDGAKAAAEEWCRSVAQVETYMYETEV